MRHTFFKRIFDLKRNQRSSFKRHKLMLLCSSNSALSSQLSVTNQPSTTPSLEDLRKAVERSTSANRTYFISFLVVLVYLLIIVASTTDYQLLIPNSLVRLPFVDTNVSLFVFYIAAPLIVLAAHFNLLQNLESHYNKLCTWRASYKDHIVPRVLIEAFLYDYAVLEKQGQLTSAVRLFSQMLYVFLAPGALLAFLWRFSDYQSLWITSWHFFLMSVDILMIGYFLRAIKGRWKITITGWFLLLLAFLQTSLLLIVTQTESALVWQAERSINKKPKYPNLEEEMVKTTLLDSLMSVMLPRITIDPYISLTIDDKPLRLKMAFDGEENFTKWFMEEGKGLDLRQRSLRGAQLKEADLRRALLESSELQWAIFTKANMQGVSIKGAYLQGANLRDANLKHADLTLAMLQGADLSLANLEDADLNFAMLQGADLGSTNLKSAGLNMTMLQGADLRGAHAELAYFIGAQLEGADMREANFQGANMLGSQLQGANMRGASLQGANMGDASLQGANMWRAKLQGADLSEANFQGAFMLDSQLQGANMRGASLQGANMRGASLQGANMWKAKLQGADLSEASLQGAYIGEAQLLGLEFDGVLVPVQSADSDADFKINADWKGIKNLFSSKEYQARMSIAEERVRNFQQPQLSWFSFDENALTDALPTICKSGYEALQGILMFTTSNSRKMPWKKLLNSEAECKPYVQKIEIWAIPYDFEWMLH